MWWIKAHHAPRAPGRARSDDAGGALRKGRAGRPTLQYRWLMVSTALAVLVVHAIIAVLLARENASVPAQCPASP
jgi:hypothetical protein